MPGRGKDCSACTYWQSYPLMEQIGICGSPESRYYNRGVSASNKTCECFALSEALERRCEECHHWYPLVTMPHLGECHNPASQRYRKAVFWDNLPGGCFEERSLERGDLDWCETCRESVLVSELYRHRSHALFAGTSQLPVEDTLEFTMAGD